MAGALPLTPIDRKTASKLDGGFNLSIAVQDCEENGHRAWSLDQSAGQPPTAFDLFSSSALKATSNFALHCIDLSSSNSLSSFASHKSKLPVVLEESEPSESLSDRKGSSGFSITSSSASSIRASFRRRSETRDSFVKAKDERKFLKNRIEGKKISFISRLLQPLKKIRDGYMTCMMGFDGAGNLSSLVQGSVFASRSKYFADKPISKRDAKNHG